MHMQCLSRLQTKNTGTLALEEMTLCGTFAYDTRRDVDAHKKVGRPNCRAAFCPFYFLSTAAKKEKPQNERLRPALPLLENSPWRLTAGLGVGVWLLHGERGPLFLHGIPHRGHFNCVVLISLNSLSRVPHSSYCCTAADVFI